MPRGFALGISFLQEKPKIRWNVHYEQLYRPQGAKEDDAEGPGKH